MAPAPHTAWRGAVTATVHAFTAGADASTLVFEVVAVSVILAVAGLTAKRLSELTRSSAAIGPA